MRGVIPAVAIVALVGCVRPVSDPAEVSKAGEMPSQAKAEQLAREATGRLNLKDPESARITEVQVDGIKKWIEPGGAFVGWQVSFYLNAKKLLKNNIDI